MGRMGGHNRKLKQELLNVWKGIQVRSETCPVAQKRPAPARAANMPRCSVATKSIVSQVALSWSGDAVWDGPC